MLRRFSWLRFAGALALLGYLLGQTFAQQTPPPSSGEQASFAYATPAFIAELDTKYPFPPPMPPSPPRYVGVLQYPAVIRAFAPIVAYRPELALVWDTLTEWEATWYYPEAKTAWLTEQAPPRKFERFAQ